MNGTAGSGTESDGPDESRSLEEEIESLRFPPKDAERLRKMAREAEARLGLPGLNPVRTRTYRPRAREPIAGVPRSFNAGRMLVIVTMFALLFSLLQLANSPMPHYPITGGFCAAVVLGQMLLFGGRKPRVASCIAGGCAMPLIWLCIAAARGGTGLLDEFRADPIDMLGSYTSAAPLAAALGVVVGYVIGTFCAGVFLIVDRRWNAGLIVPDAPLEAEIVAEGGTEQDRPNSDGPGEGDPWSEG